MNLNDRIPFTLKFHLHNHAVKSIILKNFKLLQNDSETGTIFSQPPLISFKRDKNIGNFLVRSSFQTNDQSGTFKCARSRCKTCSFIHNVEKISGPTRPIKITDHFSCTSANVIYCITCTYCKKFYIGETGKRLGDRFQEQLPDVERKFAAFLHIGSSESRKHQNKNLSSKSTLLIPTVSTSAFNSPNLFLFSRHHIPTTSVSSIFCM